VPKRAVNSLDGDLPFRKLKWVLFATTNSPQLLTLNMKKRKYQKPSILRLNGADGETVPNKIILHSDQFSPTNNETAPKLSKRRFSAVKTDHKTKALSD
jgi:hypothetical protein